MNVTVEDLAPCKKLLRIELETQAVEAGFAEVERDYQKHASIPGFRPGKAPREMVLKRYDTEIQEQAKKKLIGDTYRKAVAEKKFDVVGYPDIEEIQFSKGQALQFAATIETAPQFELPEYKGLPARRGNTTVSEDDMKRALDTLRERETTFDTVTRPARENDVVVVNFQGTSEGKPLTDLAPTAKGLTEQKNYWIEVSPTAFIPGFGTQLTGLKAGDKKKVTVDFPQDFVTPQLAGKKGDYEVEVVEVKERKLPELTDEFARKFDAPSLEELKTGVRADLQNELNFKQNRSIRQQLVETLLQKVQCELPDTMVKNEIRNVVYNIVSENQKRGIPKELIDQKKEEIFSAAQNTARERVKAGFIFRKIAEKEGIKVSQPEVAGRIQQMAASYEMPPDKLVKELEKRNGLGEIYEQILTEKVIDLLQQNARLEDPQPA